MDTQKITIKNLGEVKENVDPTSFFKYEKISIEVLFPKEFAEDTAHIQGVTVKALELYGEKIKEVFIDFLKEEIKNGK